MADDELPAPMNAADWTPEQRRQAKEEGAMKRAAWEAPGGGYDALAGRALPRVTVGFTGTQRGMTAPQLTTLTRLLIEQGHLDGCAVELHHGDCVGADAQAHEVATKLGLERHVHPPKDPKKRAFCQGDVAWPPEPYLERNHQIVRNVSLLIACPRTQVEVRRSGTWATVRFARQCGVFIIVIRPDGLAIHGSR